jgi:hypothetical protein
MPIAMQEHESSSTSESGAVGGLCSDNQRVLENLRRAQSGLEVKEVGETVCDAPPPMLALKLRSQGLAHACQQVMGREMFEKMYTYCQGQYTCSDVDMATVHKHLMAMATEVAADKRKAAVQLVEQLVFRQLFQ